MVPRLLELSNKDDEHLQSMLLSTGYLQTVDKSPPWGCFPLPFPLGDIEHPTLVATHYGPASDVGCVPVTEATLMCAGAALVLVSGSAVRRLWA